MLLLTGFSMEFDGGGSVKLCASDTALQNEDWTNLLSIVRSFLATTVYPAPYVRLRISLDYNSLERLPSSPGRK